MTRRKRGLLEVGRGDRVVLTFALGVGFVWLLRHWHTPTWLYVPALVSAWFVAARYRWITGGRNRAKQAIAEVAQAVDDHRDREMRSSEDE